MALSLTEFHWHVCARPSVDMDKTCLLVIFEIGRDRGYQYRSSHRSYSVRKGVPRNFAKFPGKHLCQSLFFDKVAGLRPATLLKKRLWHKCFPLNFAKFPRTPFLQNTSGRLLLSVVVKVWYPEAYSKSCHRSKMELYPNS